jgi:hypothetical protein
VSSGTACQISHSPYPRFCEYDLRLPRSSDAARYCEHCHVGQIVLDHVTITAISEGVRGYALDANNAEALWNKSEELVGESF